MLSKIKKKLSTIPNYIVFFRLWFGLRLLVRKIVTLPVIVKTKRGSWIFLGTDKVDDIILRHLNSSLMDVYFPPHLHLQPDEIVLDIGAHHGIFALELSSQFPGAHIFSFEPDRTAFYYLWFNRFLNNRKNITVLNDALDLATGDSFIVESEEGSWGNYLTNQMEGQSEKVRTLAVTDFLARFKIRKVEFVKFNAEGAEFVVIPELFKNNLFPTNLLLFAHPERGDVDLLIKMVMNNSYKLVNSGGDEARPWFLFSKK